MSGGASEKFCLRWNDFESNISRAFRDLREDRDFFDVTLLADGGEESEEVQAHKVILSACSPFFRNVLRRKSSNQNTVLYLKGVKHTDLLAVLNFMYHGEVNVAQDDLNSFLSVAEDLQVKGLTQNNAGTSGTAAVTNSTKKTSGESKPSFSRGSSSGQGTSSAGGKTGNSRLSSGGAGEPPSKRPRPGTSSGAVAIQHTEDDDDIQEVLPVKSEPKELVSTPTVVQSTSQALEESVDYQGDDGSGAYQDNQQLARQDDMYEEGYDDYTEEFDGQYIAQPNAADGDKGRNSFHITGHLQFQLLGKLGLT